MPLVALQVPATLSGSPAESRTIFPEMGSPLLFTLPASRTSNAIELARRGIRVTGSELVGLVPLKVMIDAGKHYLEKQERSLGVSESELIKIAVKSLGLDDLKPFDPEKKIIEYALEDKTASPLVHMDLSMFANETASESPAPGGGSVSAYLGALGVSLATMVANLSSHKRGWDERWKEFSEWGEKGQKIKDELMALVDEDTHAFNQIMTAFRLPKDSAEEKEIRSEAIQDATKYAIEIPMKTLEKSLEAMEVIKAMVETGNPNSITDAGVGALCARSAAFGAFLNVKINTADLKDEDYKKEVLKKGGDLKNKVEKMEKEILEKLESKLIN